jgi:putative transposase
MEVTKKKEREEQGQEGKKPEIDPAIIEELMKGYQRPEDLTGPGGIMEQLSKRLYERVLGAEMTHYLGYEKGQAPKVEADQKRENHRNGTSKKTLVSEDGKLEIEVPRDRAGDFEPHFIRKGQRRFGGFDSKRFGTKERLKTRPFTWLWASNAMAPTMCSDSGSSRAKEPSSG